MLRQRDQLLNLYNKFLQHKAIDTADMNWLDVLWMNYIFFNPNDEKNWQQLSESIDIVPPNIIVAQAKNTSANGSSKLARKGNNIFGIVVTTAEFGLDSIAVPESIQTLNWLTPKDLQYAEYPKLIIAIEDYVWMLNSRSQYKKFRYLRAQRHKQKLSIQTWNSPELLNLTRPSYIATDGSYSAAIIESEATSTHLTSPTPGS